MKSRASAGIRRPIGRAVRRTGAAQRLRDACETLAAHLEALRQQLDEEIRVYPKPIPRCDAQFNHLYGVRSRVMEQLESLRAVARAGTTRAQARGLEKLLATPPANDASGERELRQQLRAWLGVR